MDKWKYFDITHKHHIICNPMSEEKIDRLCQLLNLPKSAQVLDVACGKGELLIRLAELYDVSGIGVDISPYFIRDSREKHQARDPNATLEFVEMEGAEYVSKISASFDLTMCLGASWIFEGHRGTLRKLKEVTKSGGLVVVGEPFWLKEPSEEYLKADEMTRDSFGFHSDNVRFGEEEGLTCIYTIASNLDDWDNYETLQWNAVNEYIRNNPDDENNAYLVEKMEQSKEMYLRWGRDTLNWAIYVFRKN